MATVVFPMPAAPTILTNRYIINCVDKARMVVVAADHSRSAWEVAYGANLETAVPVSTARTAGDGECLLGATKK